MSFNRMCNCDDLPFFFGVFKKNKKGKKDGLGLFE